MSQPSQPAGPAPGQGLKVSTELLAQKTPPRPVDETDVGVAAARPTTRLAAVVGVLAVPAFLLPAPVVVALVVLVVVAAAVDLYDARATPAVRWVLPETVYRNVPATAVAALPADSPLTSRVLRVEGPLVLAAGATVHPSMVTEDLTASLPTGSVRPVAWDLTLPHRGRHAVHAPRLTTGGRLGLVEVRHPAREVREVVVLPDLPTARRLARTVRRRPTGVVGSSLSGPIGRGTDFETVRAYLPDDDVRFVNWKVTARLGEPATNTYRVEEGRQVTVAVDSGRLGALAAGHDPASGTRLDLLCDAAATVAVTAIERGDRVGLVVYDDVVRVRRRPGSVGESALAALLAPITPSDADGDARLLLAATGREAGGVLVLLTDLADEAVAQPLLDVVPVLAHRVQVVVLTLDEEVVAPPEPTVPLTPLQDALDRAVLLADTAGRRAAVARLRTLGVPVVSAAAAGLGEAALELYEESVPRM